MGGFFGTVSEKACVSDLFYGTDYQSHLGTRRGGLATYSEECGFLRSIHNLENKYFRSCFEDELDKFQGNSGIGVISDQDAQPMLMNSHLGRFALRSEERKYGIPSVFGTHFKERYIQYILPEYSLADGIPPQIERNGNK